MSFDFRGSYDENWPLPETLTIEEYSHVLFRPDAHLIDGRVIERQLGSYDHSLMVGRLIELLSEPLRSKGCQLCISLRLRVSATRIRVCDLVTLKPDAPRENVPTVAPLLCIEVLEHGQKPEDELDTLADYAAMGVRNIWLVDTVREQLFVLSDGALREVVEFDLPAHAITIPRRAIFEEIV